MYVLVTMRLSTDDLGHKPGQIVGTFKEGCKFLILVLTLGKSIIVVSNGAKDGMMQCNSESGLSIPFYQSLHPPYSQLFPVVDIYIANKP